MNLRALMVALLCLGCSSSQSSDATPSTETPTDGSTGPGEDQPADGPSTEPKPTADPSGPKPPGEMGVLLDAHNRRRAEHCAPPLAWSEDLAKTAQGWANKLSKSGCKLKHSETKHGENLAAGTEGTMGPEQVVDIWYQERAHYDFKAGGFSMKAGHFTQVVWAGSQKLGCGTVNCNGIQIWVCNYDPAGNMEGGFQRNVKPNGCKK